MVSRGGTPRILKHPTAAVIWASFYRWSHSTQRCKLPKQRLVFKEMLSKHTYQDIHHSSLLLGKIKKPRKALYK